MTVLEKHNDNNKESKVTIHGQSERIDCAKASPTWTFKVKHRKSYELFFYIVLINLEEMR